MCSPSRAGTDDKDTGLAFVVATTTHKGCGWRESSTRRPPAAETEKLVRGCRNRLWTGDHVCGVVPDALLASTPSSSRGLCEALVSDNSSHFLIYSRHSAQRLYTTIANTPRRDVGHNRRRSDLWGRPRRVGHVLATPHRIAVHAGEMEHGADLPHGHGLQRVGASLPWSFVMSIGSDRPND